MPMLLLLLLECACLKAVTASYAVALVALRPYNASLHHVPR